MKDFLIIFIFIFMAVSFLIVDGQEEQVSLTKKQNEILLTYCKAYEPCRKEMEK